MPKTLASQQPNGKEKDLSDREHNALCPESVDLDLDHNILDKCRVIDADEHSIKSLPGEQKDCHILGLSNQESDIAQNRVC